MSTAQTPEVVYVEENTETVMCDGGEGALGHPAVYYRFDGQQRVICGYCDREFVKKQSVKKA